MTTRSANSTTPIPQRGDRLPSFSGKTQNGSDVRLHDFYLRRNLALVFTHGADCARCQAYLHGLAERRDAIQAEAGEVLAVATEALDDAPEWPFPVLLDVGNEIHRRYGLIDPNNEPRVAIFLVDRYGIVFEMSLADADHAMLQPDEVPGWLEFIACRCS